MFRTKEDELIKETINFPQLLVEPWRAQELVDKESVIQMYRLFKVISLTRIFIGFLATILISISGNLSIPNGVTLACYVFLVISFLSLSKRKSQSIKIYSFLIAVLDICVIGYFLILSPTNEQVTLLFFSVLLSCMVLGFGSIIIIFLLSTFLLLFDWFFQIIGIYNIKNNNFNLTDFSFHIEKFFNSKQGTDLLFLIVWLLLMTFIVNYLARWSFKNEVKAQFRYKQLRHILHFNHSIIEHLKTGIIVLTTDAQIISINKRALELLGLESEYAVIKLDDLSDDLLTSFFNYKKGAPVNQNHYKHNEKAQEVAVSFSSFSEENNGVIMMSLQCVIEASSQANELKLASLGKLTAGIAHEIRNPLSAINSAAQLVAETEINEQQKKLVGIITSNTKRTNKIITNILGLFRDYKTDREMISLNEAIPRFVKQFQESNKKSDFSMIFKKSIDIEKDIFILFSAEQFDQVLWNLCTNSLHYGESEALKLEITIKITVPKASSSVFIDVSDTGTGIDKANLPRIFEPFFIGSSKGTGLGLYLVKEICEANDAKINYQTKPIGACFRIASHIYYSKLRK